VCGTNLPTTPGAVADATKDPESSFVKIVYDVGVVAPTLAWSVQATFDVSVNVPAPLEGYVAEKPPSLTANVKLDTLIAERFM